MSTATQTRPVCLCPHCDAKQRLPAVPHGAVARCSSCGTRLRHAWPGALDLSLAGSAVALGMLAIGTFDVLAVVERAGQRRTADLLSGPATLVEQGFTALAALVGFVTVAAPALSTALLLGTLLGIRLGWKRRGLAIAFAWRNRLRPWSMVEVFLVGYFVAYAKLGALVQMDPGPAFYALLAFMIITVMIDAVLERETVWAAIAPEVEGAARPTLCCETCHLSCGPGERCPRCGTGLERRKPNSLARTAALGLSALILYVPANVYPVLTVEQLGRGAPSTILGGVWELIGAGEYPLALIVFLASVTVPVLKIIGLAVMIAVVLGFLPHRHPRGLTFLYRTVCAIGRWSMIDIFMEAILASLVKFGAVATIQPGAGANAFAAVVVLTIFAAESFDPRLMWDRARR